jgi:uncharacterized membrane protein
LKAALALAAMVALIGASAAAHQGHKSPEPTAAPSASPEAESSPAAAGDDAEPAGDASMEASGDLSEQGAMAAIPWREAFTGHLHNKIVHFPLALGMAAAVFLIVAPRWPAYGPAARVLLVVAAVASVAAFFSGEAQEDQFDDSPFHAVVEVHQRFGITTILTLWTGVALGFWARARRFMPVYGVLLILLLAATGFLGGVLSHS